MFINESVVGFIALFLFLSLFHLSFLWTLLFPSFYQLGLCFTFPSSLICNVRYLFFEVSLVSWSRPISIYISLLELLSLSPCFGLLYFHFSSVSMCFAISSLSSLLNNPLVIQNSEGPFLTVLIVQISYINSLRLHLGKKKCLYFAFISRRPFLYSSNSWLTTLCSVLSRCWSTIFLRALIWQKNLLSSLSFSLHMYIFPRDAFNVLYFITDLELCN